MNHLAGLHSLWAETRGDARICIAVLDGAVDRTHPWLAEADLQQIETLACGEADGGPASQHGTHVASLIFAQAGEATPGIAPACRGLILPIFQDTADGNGIAPCSQVDLARAMILAVENGAHILNISGGEPAFNGAAHPLLMQAVEQCAEKGALIVAATGNQGCDCLLVPGALPSVLAVGALDAAGQPLDFSNWGANYRAQGVLAPGENLIGALPGGGTALRSGTSFATAIVSGVVGLLMSLQIKLGQSPDAQVVRAAILESAYACNPAATADCRPFLVGVLNIAGAQKTIAGRAVQQALLGEENPTATHRLSAAEVTPQISAPAIPRKALKGDTHRMTEPPDLVEIEQPIVQEQNQLEVAQVLPAQNREPSLVYALGKIGYDMISEARRDSFLQHMGSDPSNAAALLDYLDKDPSQAASLLWTLSLEATTIYVIQPRGAFAYLGYERLRAFLRQQIEEGVERVSIPGVIVGKAQLMSGQVAPLVMPELRGMYSWTAAALIKAVCGDPPQKTAKADERQAYDQKASKVAGFLERVYFSMQNLGLSPQDRAINYAATNALNVERIFEAALKENLELDTIEVEPSPVCRPESQCWDVKLIFFNPLRVFEQARRVYRFTVDVSDICPVMVGGVRSWSVR